MDLDPVASGLAPRPAGPRPTAPARDAGLQRVRRITRAVAAAAAGAVVVLTGYVAHARPGHHAAAGSTMQPATNSGSAGSGSPGGGSSSTSGSPESGSGYGSGGLTPPASAPQTGRSLPQVVSGSS